MLSKHEVVVRVVPPRTRPLSALKLKFVLTHFRGRNVLRRLICLLREKRCAVTPDEIHADFMERPLNHDRAK